LRAPSLDNVVTWALAVWNAIPDDLIERSFCHHGIVLARNGSENSKLDSKLLELKGLKAYLDKRIQEHLVNPSDDGWEISQKIEGDGDSASSEVVDEEERDHLVIFERMPSHH